MSKEILLKALENKDVIIAYIRDIQDIYEGISTSVRTHGRETDDLSIIIGLHQSLTLCPIFHFDFEFTHETHPRASTEMHDFYRLYSPT